MGTKRAVSRLNEKKQKKQVKAVRKQTEALKGDGLIGVKKIDGDVRWSELDNDIIEVSKSILSLNGDIVKVSTEKEKEIEKRPRLVFILHGIKASLQDMTNEILEIKNRVEPYRGDADIIDKDDYHAVSAYIQARFDCSTVHEKYYRMHVSTLAELGASLYSTDSKNSEAVENIKKFQEDIEKQGETDGGE